MKRGEPSRRATTSQAIYQSGLYDRVAGLEFAQWLPIPGLVIKENQAPLITRLIPFKHSGSSVVLWRCLPEGETDGVVRTERKKKAARLG